jgi:hypothetical protein
MTTGKRNFMAFPHVKEDVKKKRGRKCARYSRGG